MNEYIRVVGELPFLLVESRFVLIDSKFLIRSLNLKISWIPIFVPLLSNHLQVLPVFRTSQVLQFSSGRDKFCALMQGYAKFASEASDGPWMTGWPGLGSSPSCENHGQADRCWSRPMARGTCMPFHMPSHAQKTFGIAGALFKIETSSFGWLQIAIRVI